MLWKSGPVKKPRWSVPANPIKGHRKLTRHRQETRERLDMSMYSMYCSAFPQWCALRRGRQHVPYNPFIKHSPH